MDKENIQLSREDLKYILSILSVGSQMGLFRGLEQKPASELYNKIYKILQTMKEKED